MPFRYFVKQLLLPPGILLLFLLAAWWLRHSRPRLAGALFAVGLGGMWLMSLPVMVEWSARAIEREPALAPSEWSSLSERADAIVLLGSGRERGDPAWGSDQPPGSAWNASVMRRNWPKLRGCRCWSRAACTTAPRRARRR